MAPKASHESNKTIARNAPTNVTRSWSSSYSRKTGGIANASKTPNFCIPFRPSHEKSRSNHVCIKTSKDDTRYEKRRRN